MRLLECSRALAKLNRFLPRTALITIYNSLVHCHLGYLTMLWASARNNHRRPLEVMQSRALRRVLNVPNRHNTTELYRSTNVFPLKGISDMQLCDYVWTNLKSPPIDRIFHYPSRIRPRRGEAKLQIPRVNGFHGETSIALRGARTYNEMPQTIKSSKTSTELKIKLKENIIKNIEKYL